MAIQALLDQSNFPRDAAGMVTHLYDAAVSELGINPQDDDAQTRLAKLILSIVFPLTELGEDDLLDKVTAAWEWRNPPC